MINYLANIPQFGQLAREEEKRRKETSPNVLGAVANALLGLIGSGGNPMGAVVGGLQGLSTPESEGFAGQAKVGLGTYKYASDLKDKLAKDQAYKNFFAKAKLPEGFGELMKIGQYDPKLQEDIVGKYAGSLFQKKEFDPFKNFTVRTPNGQLKIVPGLRLFDAINAGGELVDTSSLAMGGL